MFLVTIQCITNLCDAFLFVVILGETFSVAWAKKGLSIIEHLMHASLVNAYFD